LGTLSSDSKIAQAEARLIGMCETVAIEQAKDFLAALHFVHQHRRGRGFVYSTPRLAMFAVIRFTALRIAQHFVGQGNFLERFGVAGVQVIGMKTACLKTINPADGFGVSVGADLQSFVMVDEHCAAAIIGRIEYEF
jgi:hypothetical protein